MKSFVAPSRVRELKRHLYAKWHLRRVAPSRVRELKHKKTSLKNPFYGRTFTGA